MLSFANGAKFLHSKSTGRDDLSVATDRQSHEDQEHSSPCAHFGTPGICAFVSVLILAMIQAKSLRLRDIQHLDIQHFLDFLDETEGVGDCFLVNIYLVLNV